MRTSRYIYCGNGKANKITIVLVKECVKTDLFPVEYKRLPCLHDNALGRYQQSSLELRLEVVERSRGKAQNGGKGPLTDREQLATRLWKKKSLIK